ncbi:MAG: peptidylprolyl isomerase [Kiritimatiellae bacterium]|nr:peptidylprolyl isomerase [Kiritimatiellia bacterium]
MPPRPFLLPLLAAAASLAALPAPGAVYVDVETTEGTFTIELDPAARNGGAAFLGLAEGWIDWVDPRNGQPRHGTPYFDGTSFSLVQKNQDGNTVVLGDYGRVFTAIDGTTNWNNGAGIEMPDDVSGPTGLVPRSVAMVQEGKPHSIDGRFAVLLADADDWYGGHWNRIGEVVEGWEVVEAIASGPRDEASGVLVAPVAINAMRVRGSAEELAAWKAVAETLAPACVSGEAGLSVEGGQGTLQCRIAGKGPWAVSHTTNLCAPVWSVDWMGFNEGDESMDRNLGFATEEGAMGRRQFFAVTAAEYPELGGPTVTGRYSFRVEWEMLPGETNQVYQYDLDVGAGTGMVWQLDLETQRTVLRSAPLDQIDIQRGGAHSTLVSFVIGAWWQIPYYWLASPEKDAPAGRYRMWEYMSGGEVWGPWAGIHRGE